MTQPAPQTLYVVLSEDDLTGRITVELDAYARFRIQMELGFGDLIKKFGHYAPRKLIVAPHQRGVSPPPPKAK